MELCPLPSFKSVAAFAVVCALTAPAAGASRWKPVQAAPAEKTRPVLLSQLSLKGRSYALYRDSNSYIFLNRGRKQFVDETTARAIRSEMVGAAWKIQYLAKLAHRPLGACRTAAAEVVIPATDDRVRVCGGETTSLRDLQTVAAKLEKDRRETPTRLSKR